MKNIFLLIASAVLLTACSSLSVQKHDGASLTRFKKIFIEHRLADGRRLDQLIAQELQRLGYDASSGPLTMAPEGVEAVVTYDDEWNYDFTLYMIDLTVQVRDGRTGQILVDASYHHPSMSGKSPAEMVQAVIDPLFERPTSNIQLPTSK
jgi:hypothetical protein